MLHFLKIFFLAGKTSLLALLLPMAITLPLCHMPPLPLLLCRSFLLCPLWPNTWRIISSGSSRRFWILDLLLIPQVLHLNSTKVFVRGLWKPGSRTCIGVKLTWIAITLSCNMRTILPLPGPRVRIGSHLPHFPQGYRFVLLAATAAEDRGWDWHPHYQEEIQSFVLLKPGWN